MLLITIVTVAIITATVKLLKWFSVYVATVRTLKDIKCDKCHWFFGHLQFLQPTQEYLLHSLRQVRRFPKITLNWFGPVVCYLSCHHPHVVKTILGSEAPKDEITYRFMRPWVGDGLLTSSGLKWKRNRRLLTPAFHFEILKGYISSTNDAATEMLEKWSRQSGSAAKVEIFHDVSLMALDNLLRCILSKNSRCQQGGEIKYLNAVKDITDIVIDRLHNVLYQIDFLFYLTAKGRHFKRALKIAHEYTERAIIERENQMKLDGWTIGETKHCDFLDMLLLARDEQGIGLSHSEICDEVDTFVFEGHDTISSAISWAFYNLAKYPVWQKKCRDEVINILNGRKRVDWEDLSKFPILTMLIKESMRLYPPVYGIGRQTDREIHFSRGFGFDQLNVHAELPDGHSSRTMPKNSLIGVNIFMLHHNPSVWDDPEVFDPTRFLPENIQKRSPHAYVPFSSGPRNCIGQNFAMNEMKVVLALALSRYVFAVDEAYPEPEMEPHIILRSKNGIHVLVTKH